VKDLVECTRCGDPVPPSETTADGRCDYCATYTAGPMPPDQEEERWGCLFPDECLMPGEHTKSECHTAEMLEEYEGWCRS
jgi:hypothetical protein